MIDGQGASVTLAPTKCPRFLAACVTCGVELEANTPGISNVYSKGRVYDPDEPGDISYHLDLNKANPLAIAKVWMDPKPDLTEAAALPARMIKARTEDEWLKIADDLDALHIWAAVGYMRMFSDKKFGIDSKLVSDEEERAAQILSDMPDAIRNATKRNGGAIAAKLESVWMPAMFAWVKAWIAQYLELRDVWKAARPSIKIEREGRFPLIIPKGKDFEKLMKRWAR